MLAAATICKFSFLAGKLDLTDNDDAMNGVVSVVGIVLDQGARRKGFCIRH